ncbi:MAG TPA: lipase maturation factor family protein, partial [Thermoanaerobaculia bacterium]|nr:lipase maturation factor family protein [Thermoanaerobaculia bacterium]
GASPAGSSLDSGGRGRPPLHFKWADAIVLPLVFTLSILIFLAPASGPARLVEPFRIVNNYGLFAVMTRERYEIEFQGTRDGKTWIAYPFRYKPQRPQDRPRIFAPYQPRFDWNLWFASLGGFEDNTWILNVETRLMQNEPAVLQLFKGNPFGEQPPLAVRAVLWQYWFTTRDEHARSGNWWKRQLLGRYAPSAWRGANGIEFR